MPPAIGLDIGGANLKAAHSGGAAKTAPFAVWRQPEGLSVAIQKLLAATPAADSIAVTMTAELCDCFETKAAGVSAILDAVQTATHGSSCAAGARVWLNDGRLVSMTEACGQPLQAAAANWLALATWAGRFCPAGPALVIDIGSTTTDIVALRDGVPVPRGRTDTERLSCGELVYSGVRRTPAFALARTVKVRGQACRLAAETFATTHDVYLLLGDAPEDPNDRDTADGRPATRSHAASRIARTVAADRTTLTEAEIESIARQIAVAHWTELVTARRVVETALGEPPRAVVIAGSGEFLARRVLQQSRPGQQQVFSLSEQHGPDVSSAACAYALAVLAAERAGE